MGIHKDSQHPQKHAPKYDQDKYNEDQGKTARNTKFVVFGNL